MVSRNLLFYDITIFVILWPHIICCTSVYTEVIIILLVFTSRLIFIMFKFETKPFYCDILQA